MEENSNFELEERKAGSIARAALRQSYLGQVRQTFQKRKGNLEKSNFSARYREGRLDRLVLTSPGYSFKNHFGSSKTGTQKESNRRSASVKTFTRHVAGISQTVQAHNRRGTTVKAFNKNREYKATDHITKALNQTTALQTLATALGNNRAVLITSQINF